MCTVQVLITADVMHNIRRNVVRPPRRICRKLFCDDVREEAAIDPQAAMRRAVHEISEEAKARWNFDFLSGIPLPGRYQWVPMGAGRDRIEEPIVAEVRTAQTQTELPEESTAESSTSKQTTKQSKITDYLHSRKRTRRNSTSVASPKLKKMRRSTNCNTSEDSRASSVSST
ncbi:cyclin-dependent kinase inhibitor 1B-like [Uloborus diversus]|uniref:cyclin-dependent kinase inhibitor 1B-like n=1 Tax=Uloborus diversus TaxID=327109 RepID=UPI002409AF97|nr:cyclin-dependent kinase inhibitor 1B-like [Uloborus diversus]